MGKDSKFETRNSKNRKKEWGCLGHSRCGESLGTGWSAAGIRCFQSFGEPHFDEALTGNADAVRSQIEAVHHPSRKIDVYFCRGQVEALFTGRKYTGRAEIEIMADVFAGVGLCIELRGGNAGGRRDGFTAF